MIENVGRHGIVTVTSPLMVANIECHATIIRQGHVKSLNFQSSPAQYQWTVIIYLVTQDSGGRYFDGENVMRI